jgi:hypothetical protein
MISIPQSRSVDNVERKVASRRTWGTWSSWLNLAESPLSALSGTTHTHSAEGGAVDNLSLTIDWHKSLDLLAIASVDVVLIYNLISATYLEPIKSEHFRTGIVSLAWCFESKSLLVGSASGVCYCTGSPGTTVWSVNLLPGTSTYSTYSADSSSSSSSSRNSRNYNYNHSTGGLAGAGLYAYPAYPVYPVPVPSPQGRVFAMYVRSGSGLLVCDVLGDCQFLPLPLNEGVFGFAVGVFVGWLDELVTLLKMGVGVGGGAGVGAGSAGSSRVSMLGGGGPPAPPPPPAPQAHTAHTARTAHTAHTAHTVHIAHTHVLNDADSVGLLLLLSPRHNRRTGQA